MVSPVDSPCLPQSSGLDRCAACKADQAARVQQGKTERGVNI